MFNWVGLVTLEKLFTEAEQLLLWKLSMSIKLNIRYNPSLSGTKKEETITLQVSMGRGTECMHVGSRGSVSSRAVRVPPKILDSPPKVVSDLVTATIDVLINLTKASIL